MTDTNIEIVRGDTFAFGIELTDDSNQPITDNLSSAYFTCRQSAESILFQKSLGDGISKVSDGKYRVRVAPADTANVVAGRYSYDFQIGLNSDIFTILKGVLDIQQDQTY